MSISAILQLGHHVVIGQTFLGCTVHHGIYSQMLRPCIRLPEVTLVSMYFVTVTTKTVQL